MSTVWTKHDSEEWVATTFYGGEPGTGPDRVGPAVDFGARVERAGEVFMAAVETGDAPFARNDDTGAVVTGAWFAWMVAGKAWTHGRFGGTMTVAQAVEYEVG